MKRVSRPKSLVANKIGVVREIHPERSDCAQDGIPWICCKQLHSIRQVFAVSRFRMKWGAAFDYNPLMPPNLQAEMAVELGHPSTPSQAIVLSTMFGARLRGTSSAPWPANTVSRRSSRGR